MADGSAPLLAVLRFALFAGLALVLPGLALQRLLRLRPDPALVLPAGAAAASLAAFLAVRLGQPLLFPLLLAATAAGLLRRAPLPGTHAVPGPSLRGALPAILLLVALFALTQYGVNRAADDGSFRLDVGEHADTALHVGLTFELVAGYPPQVPGLAGVPLRYHLGAHLLRSAAVRWAGVHPYDLLSRFEITLWAIGLVLVLRRLAQVVGLGPRAVALAGFVPLASDLSFVPGLALGGRYWAFKLGDAFVEAVFYANTIAPALLIALGALVAIGRHEEEPRPGGLALAAILAAAVAPFKVFTAAQLLLALGLAWLLRRRPRALLAPMLVLGVVLAAVVVSSTGGDAPPPRVVVGVFTPTDEARAAFGLPPAAGLRHVLSGLAWLCLSLGLRVVGLPGAWRALRGPGLAGAGAGAMALVGWPLATFLSVRVDPGHDESFYFLQASGLVLWLFGAAALVAPAPRRWALSVAVSLTALVPAAEFVARKAAQPPERVAAASVRAMRALRAASAPGDVVLTRPRVERVPLPVVLAGRRVVLADYIGYWQQFTTLEAVAERREGLRAFFRSTDPGEARRLAARFGARFVALSGEPAAVEATAALRPLFREDGQRVYAIEAAFPEPAPAGP